MKKIIFIMIIALLLNFALVNAITQQEINEAKNLINSTADCKSLSDSQLEIIGEYYMEQMHPGEAHEPMHKMMGLQEGSEAEKQFHINMAKTMYCGEGGMMGGGMMNMVGNNMRGPGGINMMGSGMMGNWGYSGYRWNIWSTLHMIMIVGLIILTCLGIIKLWKDLLKNRRR